MNSELHTVVVGAGPLGAATARHLSLAVGDVVIVGPREPDGYAEHDGFWSAHYDQGRLCHMLEAPFLSTILTRRSVQRFAELTAQTGISFTHEMPSLTVLPDPESSRMPEGTDWFKFEWILRNCRDFDVPIEQLDEQELRERFPQLQFAPDHIGVLQPEAMLVNPRRFVAAQLAAAEQQGVTRLDDTVTAVEEHADHVVVHTGGGERLGATNVVLAAGAYLNLQPLSPRRLAFDTYGATLTLGVVADPTTADFPALMYYKMTEENPFAGILAPPLAYPDGTWCIKASGSSLFDTPLDSVEAITAWVRTGGDERDVAPFLALMSEVLPAVVVEEVRLRPCLVTRNVTGDAYVDFVTDRIAVVTEGERGVECGDEIGRLAARMIIAGEWDDSLPAAAFAARFGDD